MSSCVPTKCSSQNNDRFLLCRLHQLSTEFDLRYGVESDKPKLIARAPGRVNLIGEHIDYMGYSVLPMAIDQDILIMGRVTDKSTIQLTNLDKSKYEKFECEMSAVKKELETRSVSWYKYFLCGHHGITEYLSGDGSQHSWPGLELMVDGRVPPSAGLSSSSAFVCAAALITAKLYTDRAIDKSELAQICCECEKYIGTQGGGMDQAISLLAEEGKAKHIEFNPIRASDVTLPEGHVFVISHSLAELNKAATSDFNERVVECRLACQILALKLGLDWRSYRRLGDLQKNLDKSYDEMLVMVDTYLHTEPFTLVEMCTLFGITADELVEASMSANTAHLVQFKLYQRAKHVFSEAHRVIKFKELCEKSTDDIAVKLGELMNESHMSTKNLYECSHIDLDLLTDICRQAGALGSRLTGAGWGGCAVSMVPSSNLDNFMEKVKSQFYTAERLNGRDINMVLFQSKPAGGACFYSI